MRFLHLEVIYSGDHNLSCFYMAEVAKVVASSFKNEIKLDTVHIFKEEGAKRYYHLSVSLYGEEMVRKQLRLAPVPSMFIDGKLVFDRIPQVEELEEVVLKMFREKRRTLTQ